MMIIVEVKFVNGDNKVITQLVDYCYDNTWEIEQLFERVRNLIKEEIKNE